MSEIARRLASIEEFIRDHKALFHTGGATGGAYNYLINGGFDFARRQAPGTLTTITTDKYGADRWRQSRENADLQYQRNDATGETGLTSNYYGKYKKITNSGKFMVIQIIEGVNSIPLRGQTVTFQIKMKSSSAKTIRIGIIELQSAGTIDTIPATFVTAWGAASTDPTLGANLAVITAAESKSVTTSWQNFSVSVSVPSTSKNIIVGLWSDSAFSAGDELNVAEAFLSIGNTVQSWQPRLIQDELDLCMRYYFKTFPTDTAPAQNAGVESAHRSIAGKAGANPQFTSFRFPVPMRVSPTTVTFYNPSAANAQARDSSGGVDCSGTVSSGIKSSESLGINTTGNAGTLVGNALDVHISADAEL